MLRPALWLVAAICVAAGLYPSVAAGDWTVTMMQSTFDNMNYTAMTNVGTSSMCAYEGVCDGGSARTGPEIRSAADWIDAAAQAGRAGIEPLNLGYDRSAEITRLVERDILASARQRDPATAEELQAAFAQSDISATFWSQASAEFGFQADDLGNAVTSYWLLLWIVANNVSYDSAEMPDAAKVRAVADQFKLALSANPGIQSLAEPGRQLLAEVMIYNFMMLDAAWQQANQHGNAEMRARLSDVWHDQGRDFFGLDLRAIDITSEGMQRHD
jgi:hypothetical protein